MAPILGVPQRIRYRSRETLRVTLHEWTVASALIERGGRLLLVRNARHGGHHDWSTPGGVVDPDDISVLDGLAREVAEETGLVVTQWAGPVYEVIAHAPDMGWRMRCEVHLAVAADGEVVIDDPDGIVVEGAFFAAEESIALLADGPAWVRDPIVEWLSARWAPSPEPADLRRFEFTVHGTSRSSWRVERR